MARVSGARRDTSDRMARRCSIRKCTHTCILYKGARIDIYRQETGGSPGKNHRCSNQYEDTEFATCCSMYLLRSVCQLSGLQTHPASSWILHKHKYNSPVDAWNGLLLLDPCYGAYNCRDIHRASDLRNPQDREDEGCRAVFLRREVPILLQSVDKGAGQCPFPGNRILQDS